jgi:hypothetical protein
MSTHRKFWLVVVGSIAVLVIIACSCSNLIPTRTPQIATQPPINVAPASGEAIPGLQGAWIDPDSSGGGTVSTIVWTGNEYQVISVINTNRGPNELTKTDWSNGVLTWEYCPEGMHCITQSTVSVNGDTLTVSWAWSDGGNSGTSDLQRQP